MSSLQTDERERNAVSKPPLQFNAKGRDRLCFAGLRAVMHRTRQGLLVVIAVSLIVHGALAVEATEISNSALPVPVAELRELILSAVQSGNIEDLRPAFEHTTGAPDVGFGGTGDPIAALKRLSEDGSGLDILAAMGEILRIAPAALPLGKDLENNLIFVWPYLAEAPLDSLSGGAKIDLLSLVPLAKAAEMREKKRWLWWRLAISADGSLLMFKKLD